MNKLIKPLSVSSGVFALLLTILVLFIAASANAESIATSTRSTNPEIKAEVMKARLASSTRPVIQGSWKERIQQFSVEGFGRLSQMINKMQEITTNLQNRAKALGEKYNVDVSDTLNKLAQAEAKLNEAESALSDIRSDMASITGSASPEVAKSNLETLRGKLQKLRENLHQARALMHEALAELKADLQNAGVARGSSDAVRQNTASSSNQ